MIELDYIIPVAIWRILKQFPEMDENSGFRMWRPGEKTQFPDLGLSLLMSGRKAAPRAVHFSLTPEEEAVPDAERLFLCPGVNGGRRGLGVFSLMSGRRAVPGA